MTTAQVALSTDHPMMKAWNKFCETDEFKNALRWAVETKYDDGRQIDPLQIEQHAKGAMWLAFTKGIESAENDYLTDPLALAILFHVTYERLAPQSGYETRKETRIFDPESPNGKLMLATCSEIQNAIRKD